MGLTGVLLGQAGEEYAEKLLKKLGYKILERNYRCKTGELDIVALDKDVLVFVEVRTKSSLAFGSPADSITQKKIKKLIKLSQYFLCEKNIENVDCRFDIVSVMTQNGEFEGEVIENAIIL